MYTLVFAIYSSSHLPLAASTLQTYTHLIILHISIFSICNTDPLLHMFTFAMSYPQLQCNTVHSCNVISTFAMLCPQLQCNTDLLLCEPILLVLIKIERLYSFTHHFTSSICNVRTTRLTFYAPVYLYIFRHLQYNTHLRLRICCGSQGVCVCRLWRCVCVCRLWRCVCVCVGAVAATALCFIANADTSRGRVACKT